MRKMQHQQAVEFINLLGQAHDEIKTLIEKKQIADAKGLLADCQNGAIELGNLIEETEGENCKTVSLIEIYCEQIYNIHEELTQAENVNVNKAYKILRQHLVKIENSIRNDIIIKKEVVFLPYKASMWDSLESVWKAADADDLCDAYVVPIPYYDKNPDGSFGALHYEKDQYPEYVPVTNYEEYDFGKRRPDVIFIHNPYDDYNKVTSVHPFFYSKDLKQYTEKLVYIPYFVLGEISPDDKRNIDKMSHFCVVPGVFYADKVIVQSEDMRTIYINVLTETFGQEGKSIWEDKIIGLGSPKIDKLLNTNKEDLDIPREWDRIIRRPDGDCKKIVFYNTSVSALLKNGEKMLAKMQDVFKVFKENMDDVALLWRPHPLIEATIQSMRPELREEYEKIVKQYKAEGWGIYDDTADVDRAIILSDSYYGDTSSVMNMYHKMNKPVMVQNCDILYEEKEDVDYLFSSSFVVDREYIWFVPGHYNILCKYDMAKEKLVLVRTLPINNKRPELYGNIVKVDNYIVLVPSNTNEIGIYDITADEITMVEMKDYDRDKNWFYIYAVWEGYVYLFPCNYPAICKVDINKKSITYITDWYEKFDFKSGDLIFAVQGCIIGSKVYLLMENQNCVFRFDMADASYGLIVVGNEEDRYSTITCVNDKLYLTNQSGDVVICDMDGSGTKKINNTVSKKKESRITSNIFYTSSVVDGEDILFFPGTADCVVRFQTQTHIMQRYKDSEFVMDEGKRYLCEPITSMLSYVQKQNSCLYGFNINGQYFFESNLRTGEKRRFYIPMEEMSDDRIRELYMQRTEKSHVASEYIPLYLRLRQFIGSITDSAKKDIIKIPELAGHQIYVNI